MFQSTGIPRSCPLPAGWTGELANRRPVAYRPVEAGLVAEVFVDLAIDGPFP